MGRLVFLAFLVIPLIEIACFVLIGQAIGLWPTLAGVLVTAVAGSLLLRHQGLALISEIRTTMGRGALPARALAEAMMVGIAGVLLLTPGYFTDGLGLVLLIPPVRSAIYAFLRSRFQIIPVGAGGGGQRGASPPDDHTIELDSDDWRRQ